MNIIGMGQTTGISIGSFRWSMGLRTPVRLVIGLLTLFVLIAGPINLYLLNRKDVRAWFLDLTRSLTSALVFVVSIFSEGVPRAFALSL